MAFVNDNFGSSIPLDAMDEVAIQTIHLARDYCTEIERHKSIAIQVKNADRELDELENESSASNQKKMECPPRIEVMYSNCASVSESQLNIRQHAANLKKTLEFDKIKANEELKSYAATLAHYETMWHSYDAIYERRPSAIKRKEMKTLIKTVKVMVACAKLKCKEICDKIKQFTAVKEKQGTVRTIQLAEIFKERIDFNRQKADIYVKIQKLDVDIKEITREKELLLSTPVVSLVVVPAQMEIELQVTPVPVVAAAPLPETLRRDPPLFPSFELPKLQLPSRDSSLPQSRYRALRGQMMYESAQLEGNNTPGCRDYRHGADGIRRVLAAGFSPSITYSSANLATSTPLHGLRQESIEMGNFSTIEMPVEMESEIPMDCEADLCSGEGGDQNFTSSIMMDSSEYDNTPVGYHQGGGSTSNARGTPSLGRRSALRREEGGGDGLAVVDVRGRRASWTKGGGSFKRPDTNAVPMDSGIDLEPSPQLMDQGKPRHQQNRPGIQHPEPLLLQSIDEGAPRSQQHTTQEQQLVQHSQSFDKETPKRQQHTTQGQPLIQHNQSFDQRMPRSQQHMTKGQQFLQHTESLDRGAPRRQRHMTRGQHRRPNDQGMPRSQQHITKEQQRIQHRRPIDQGMPGSQQHMTQEEPLVQEHVVKPNCIGQQIVEAPEPMLTSQQPTLQGADIQNDAVEMNYSTSQTDESMYQQSVNQGRKEPVPQQQAMDTESSGHVHSQRRDANQLPDVPAEDIQMDCTSLPLGKKPAMQDDAICQAKDVLLEIAQTEDPARSLQTTSSQGNRNKENVPPQIQTSEPEHEEFPSETVSNLSQTSRQSIDEILDVKKRQEFLKQMMQSPEFNYSSMQMRKFQRKEQVVDHDTPQTYFVSSFMNYRDDASLKQVDGIETQGSSKTHRDDGDGPVGYPQGKEEREPNPQAHVGGGDTLALQPINTGDSADKRYDEFGTSARPISPARIISRIRATDKSHVVDDNPAETVKGNVGRKSPVPQDQAIARGHGQDVTPDGYKQGHAQEKADGYLRGTHGYTRGHIPDQAPVGYTRGRAPDETPVGYHRGHAPDNAEGYPRGRAPDQTPGGYHWGPTLDKTPVIYHRGHAPGGTPDYGYTGDKQSPYFGGAPGLDSDAWLSDPVSQSVQAVSETGGWQSPTVVVSPEMSTAGANPFGKQTATPQDSAGFFHFGSNSNQPPQSNIFGSSDPPASGNVKNSQPPNRSEAFTFNFDNKSNKPSIFKLF